MRGGVKMTRWLRIRPVCLQFSSKLLKFFFDESCVISAFTKIFFEKLRMIEIGPRGRWKRSSIFQMSHPSKKSMYPKLPKVQVTQDVQSPSCPNFKLPPSRKYLWLFHGQEYLHIDPIAKNLYGPPMAKIFMALILSSLNFWFWMKTFRNNWQKYQNLHSEDFEKYLE